MRDHTQWRPNWHRSEFHSFLEDEREERRHAIAALLGALTALACFGGIVWLLT